MELGMVGLGRMGTSLVRRLLDDGHRCVVTDLDPEAVHASVTAGAVGAADLVDLVSQMHPPRHVWVMVPAAAAGRVVHDIGAALEPGDTIIDGGNSLHTDDHARAVALAELGVHYVDVGTSGGVHGRDRGFCLMVGGDDEPVARLTTIFDSLAPGVATAPRTPGHTGALAPGESGWLHCGPTGAGHFVKMVHNGIEYGMMAALAEGLAILDSADLGREDRPVDAETAPMRHPEHYRYGLDPASITEVWRRGSVISSWLVDLTAKALAHDGDLTGFEGRVSDSGEGRWTVQSAVDLGVPAPTITAALYQRFSSRGRADFGDRALSAMRKEFGGHHEKQE